MNLNEAFRALDALNEDTFSISDDGIAKLADFQQSDDLEDEIRVIDPEAETEEDLQDSYVGKVILDCGVCHSKIYKTKEEIELNDDQTLANVGEECPFCYTSDGFKIIGEVCAFNDSKEDEDVEEVETDADESDDDVIEEAYEDTDGIMGGDKGQKYSDVDLKAYWEKEKDNDPVLKNYNGNFDAWHKDTTSQMKKVNESVMNGGQAEGGFKDTYVRPGGSTSKLTHDKLDGKKTRTVKAKDLKPGMVTDTGTITNVTDIGWVNGKQSVEVSYSGIGNRGSYAADQVPADREYQVLDESAVNEDIFSKEEQLITESLEESVNNVNVETDDDVINVATDDNGKVTVTTEPKVEDVADEDEVIVPVSPESQDEIMTAGEEVDTDIEEFDEESFDALGESYLKEVYDNVDSYRTVNVASNDTSIVVEGVIKFNTGAEKKTSFILEAKDCTRDGKYRFTGSNKQLTEGRRGYTVSGKVVEGKFISESLNYNYKSMVEGVSRRIYGSIKG